jgi:hypothetical protein
MESINLSFIDSIIESQTQYIVPINIPVIESSDELERFQVRLRIIAKGVETLEQILYSVHKKQNIRDVRAYTQWFLASSIELVLKKQDVKTFHIWRDYMRGAWQRYLNQTNNVSGIDLSFLEDLL